jgi:hypothetical protein
MSLRHSRSAVALLLASALPASAHPGPHDHFTPADAIAHVMSPFHLALAALAVLIGAFAILVVRRRTQGVHAKRKEPRR